MGKHKTKILPKRCCVDGCTSKGYDKSSYICKKHLSFLSIETKREYFAILAKTDHINTDFFDRKELIEAVKRASEEIQNNPLRDI